MMDVAAAIFDMDGLLIDSEPAWREAEIEAFAEVGVTLTDAMCRETTGLREQVRNLENRVEDLSANERALRETLVTAQEMSEDLKRTALKEAELMISEAEVKGEKILDAAHRRAAKLAEDIRELKGLRIRLGSVLRANIETHLSLVASLTEDAEAGEDPLADGKVAFLNRKQAGEA